MEQYVSSCRVCLCFIKDNKLEQDCNDNAEVKPQENLIKFFFEKSTSFKILPDEPQTCCSFCYGELMQSLRFMEKCERTQRVLESARKEVFNGIDGESETVSLRDYSQILDIELNEGTTVKEEWGDFLASKTLKIRSRNPISVKTEEMVMRKLKTFKKPKVVKAHKSKPSETTDAKLLKVICPYCATLVKSSYLENHIKNVHMEPRHTYICDICNTQLSSKKSVIRHMNHVHLKMQKYKCKICNTEFPNESLRKAHLLHIHKVVPPKACPYCDYRAFTKAHITRHIQRHRGDRRFKCPTCSFAFVTLLQLQTHSAVHSDERNFECNECLKRFKTKKNLSAHKKCHLAYEYECGVCKRAFLTNQMMRNHVVKNHPEYELPPPGTILNKEAVKRMKNIEAEILQYKPENCT